jgi:hypothetical protein
LSRAPSHIRSVAATVPVAIGSQYMTRLRRNGTTLGVPAATVSSDEKNAADRAWQARAIRDVRFDRTHAIGIEASVGPGRERLGIEAGGPGLLLNRIAARALQERVD